MTIQTAGTSATATPKTIGDLYRANSPQSYPLTPEELALIKAGATKAARLYNRNVLRNFAGFCLATLSIAFAWKTNWMWLSLIGMVIFWFKTSGSYPHRSSYNNLDSYDYNQRHTDYRPNEEIQKYRAILDATDDAENRQPKIPELRYFAFWLFICVPAMIALLVKIHY
jgi:hypothetical protein